MRKSRFAEHQVVCALKRAESGLPVKDLCRELGISSATFYQWRSKYGALEASDLKKPKDLEPENRRLKQMVADLSLDHRCCRTSLKKALSAALRRNLVDFAQAAHEVSERRGCRLLGLSRSVRRYQPRQRYDSQVRDALQELVARHPRFGCRKLTVLLRKAGHEWNHKRVRRVYQELKLQLKTRRRVRLRPVAPQSLLQPICPNQAWSRTS